MAHSDHSEYQDEFVSDHPHSYDHSEPHYSLIAILGGITAVLLVVVGIGIQVYYNQTEENLIYNEVLAQPSWPLQDLRNKEAWELSHYGTWDKTKGTYRLPIDQAMKLVVEEAAGNRLKYPTNNYAVKTESQLAAASPAVSPAGAAAVDATQNTGIKSSPNVQQSAPQQPAK